MALTFVAAATGRSGTGADYIDAGSLNVAAGDILVAAVYNTPEGFTCTIQDHAGATNVFTVLAESNSGNGNIVRMGYLLEASADATCVIRATLSAGSYSTVDIVVMQFRPDSGDTITLDTGPSSAGDTWSTAVQTAAFSTAGTDEVVVLGVTHSAGTMSATQIGDTNVTAVSETTTLLAGYLILTGTQSNIHGQSTISTAASWAACAVSIRSEGAGGTAVPVFVHHLRQQGVA